MDFKKEDIISLVDYLKMYGDKYWALIELLMSHADYFDFGPNSMGAALFIKDLKTYFPDVIWAMNIPEEDLPLYASGEHDLEAPIARWRLKRIAA